MMEPAIAPFRDAVARVPLAAPRLRFVSNVTGTWITDEQAQSPDYWAEHLRRPVRFAAGIEHLLDGPQRPVFLEAGPGRTLATFVRQILPAAGAHAVTSLRHPDETQPDLPFALGALGRLWLAGVSIDWQAFWDGERRRRVVLPTYPFERQRYWVDGRPRDQAAASRELVKSPDLSTWFYTPAWKPSPALPLPFDGACVVFEDGRGVGAALAARLEAEGRAVVRVTAGAGFAALGSGAYAIDPGRASDYDALFDALDAAQVRTGRIVHLWRLDAEPRADADDANALRYGFYSFLRLAQALSRRPSRDWIDVLFAASGLARLGEGDVVDPAAAAATGLCLTVSQEQPHLACGAIDLPAGETAESLAEALAAEVSNGVTAVSIAWRGAQRYEQAYDAVVLGASGAGTPLRPGGAYLITGGLGNIGLAIADRLARVPGTRVVLVGRNAPPAREEWAGLLAAPDAGAGVARRIRAIEAIEARAPRCSSAAPTWRIRTRCGRPSGRRWGGSARSAASSTRPAPCATCASARSPRSTRPRAPGSSGRSSTACASSRGCSRRRRPSSAC